MCIGHRQKRRCSAGSGTSDSLWTKGVAFTVEWQGSPASVFRELSMRRSGTEWRSGPRRSVRMARTFRRRVRVRPRHQRRRFRCDRCGGGERGRRQLRAKINQNMQRGILVQEMIRDVHARQLYSPAGASHRAPYWQSTMTILSTGLTTTVTAGTGSATNSSAMSIATR